MIDKIISVMKKDGKCVLNVGNARYPIEKDCKEYLKSKYKIIVKNLTDYHIGGIGIGKRTGNHGEPFLYFEK